MEYIGQDDEASPMLRDTRLGSTALAKVAGDIADFMDRSYNKAGLVHGDLSEYNILIKGKETVLIDVGQSVVLEHPMAKELFSRDLQNIGAYFNRQSIDFDWQVLHNQIISHGKKRPEKRNLGLERRYREEDEEMAREEERKTKLGNEAKQMDRKEEE
jgi:RIO kinase 1